MPSSATPADAVVEHRRVKHGDRAGILAETENVRAIHVGTRNQQIDAACDVQGAHPGHGLADHDGRHGVFEVAEVAVEIRGVLFGAGAGFAHATRIEREDDKPRFDDRLHVFTHARGFSAAVQIYASRASWMRRRCRARTAAPAPECRARSRTRVSRCGNHRARVCRKDAAATGPETSVNPVNSRTRLRRSSGESGWAPDLRARVFD